MVDTPKATTKVVAASKTATKKAPSAKRAAPATTAAKTAAKTPAKAATKTVTKTTAKTATIKAAPAKAAPAKAAPAKVAARTSGTTKAPATSGRAAATTRTATKKATVSTPTAKKSQPKAAAAKRASAAALRVRDDEAPWTAKELREIRAEIDNDVAQLRAEIQVAEADLVGLMRDAGDGAGDDQADAGAKTFEREQEISLANNARDMLDQNLHALERLDNGTYGICESCGNAIGKLRLQAAPRATLCVTCKTKQERR